jgi:hypothetical protein
MAEMTATQRFRGRRSLPAALLISAAGWIGVATGLGLTPRDTWFAYLAAFTFVASLALGALVFLMVGHAIGSVWNLVLRRLVEAVVGTIPVLALLFVPLLFGLDELYPWVDPDTRLPEHAQELLHHKQGYLAPGFFTARTAVYFALWTVAAVLLRRWSLAQERAASAGSAERRARVLSSALLPPVALAITFASFDWLMSLQPLWFSSIFGVYYFAGGFVASFGLLTVLAYAAQRTGLSAGLIRPPHYHALGRLMFAFTVFWAYATFFQAMLIQIANRPEEVEFYVARLEHGWSAVAWLLLFGHFVLPFLVLLPRAGKFRAPLMAAVGSWLVLVHYVDIYWLVAPAQPGRGPAPTLWDLVALAAVAGPASASALWQLRGRPVVPVHHPELAQSIAYRSPT